MNVKLEKIIRQIKQKLCRHEYSKTTEELFLDKEPSGSFIPGSVMYSNGLWMAVNADGVYATPGIMHKEICSKCGHVKDQYFTPRDRETSWVKL